MAQHLFTITFHLNCIRVSEVPKMCINPHPPTKTYQEEPQKNIYVVHFPLCMIYLLLVKTNGVAFLEPLRRAKDCSFTSEDASLPAPLPEKGQTPLALDPLPPILRDKA